MNKVKRKLHNLAIWLRLKKGEKITKPLIYRKIY